MNLRGLRKRRQNAWRTIGTRTHLDAAIQITIVIAVARRITLERPDREIECVKGKIGAQERGRIGRRADEIGYIGIRHRAAEVEGVDPNDQQRRGEAASAEIGRVAQELGYAATPE